MSFARLFDVTVLSRLEDRDKFIEIISGFYIETGKRWGCNLRLSDRRLGDAFDSWREDVIRTELVGFKRDKHTQNSEGVPKNPIKLDHFKHASIISFWLRRFNPINELYLIDSNGDRLDDVTAASSDQTHFADFGSELGALLCGLYIVINYEIQAYEARMVALGLEVTDEMRLNIISEIKLSEIFMFEYPTILRSKNISWHALYMMFHSLLERFPISSPYPRSLNEQAA